MVNKHTSDVYAWMLFIFWYALYWSWFNHGSIDRNLTTWWLRATYE